MKKLIILFLSLCLFFPNSTLQAAVGQASIGTNIAGTKVYTGDLTFVDRMRHSTDWTTPQETVNFDNYGYPLEVATEGQQMTKLLIQNMADIYPSGDYTLSWKGTGSIWVRYPVSCPEFSDGQCIISGTDISKTISVPGGDGMIQLKILASDANDPIRDLSFVMPGFESSYQEHPVHPDFLASLQEFSFIRVMDLLRTNYAEDVVDWSDRVTRSNHAYTDGVAWEDIVYIVNQNDQDIWINIPHKASDDYVLNLIDFFNTNLEAERHIYIEYSNEVWNSIFPQYTYCRDKGREVFGQSLDVTKAVAWWNAKRSAEIWQLFENNLASDRSYTRVISGQGVNSYRASQSLEALADPSKNPTSQRADALAIAYYFGAGALDDYLTENGTIPKSSVTVEDINNLMNNLDDILDLGEESIYGVREAGMIDHSNLAKEYNIRVVGYEGGQSYYVGQGYDQLVKKATIPILEALSNHPRMEDLYEKFLRVFFDNDGKEFANFSFINVPESSGSWGIYDYSGDSEGLYKLKGLRDMMMEIGQNSSIEMSRSDVDASGGVSAVDASLIMRKALGRSMAGTSWQGSATTGDVNCDGEVNILDALSTLRYSLALDMSGSGWCE